MTKKKCDSELIIRIDERVKTLFNNIPIIKQDIKDIKEMVSRHDTRITIIEREHEKPWHTGGLGFIIRMIFGK